jgi:hypothetical protein
MQLMAFCMKLDTNKFREAILIGFGMVIQQASTFTV